MNIAQSFSTPVSYLVDIGGLGLVKAGREELRRVSLLELILLTDNFNSSKNLNQIGKVKLALIEEEIKKSDEYRAIKDLI